MEESKQCVKALEELMDKFGREPVCVAFSGGVDSSLLLKMACMSGKKYGNPVYAVTFDTVLHPACDMETAESVAKELQAEHVVLKVNELELEAMRDNPPERCYLCKRHLFETLLAFAAEKNISCVMDGTNEDDLHVYRPGIRALKELNILSPLALCHITKAQVKQLAGQYGISVASRPSAPCMATRLPYGEKLDYDLLRRIEKGEAYLRTLFTGNIRLRVHSDTVRLELDREQMEEVLIHREELCRRLKALGFTYITLDLEGFRSGSMDLRKEDSEISPH